MLVARAAAKGAISVQLILLDLSDRVLIVQSSVSSMWKCPVGLILFNRYSTDLENTIQTVHTVHSAYVIKCTRTHARTHTQAHSDDSRHLKLSSLTFTEKISFIFYIVYKLRFNKMIKYLHYMAAAAAAKL